MIELEHIYKCFGTHHVLNNINYVFNDKTFYVLTGENGSGKSCLLYILGFIDKRFAGNIYFDHQKTYFSKRRDVQKRKESISFLMAKGNLISYLTCEENLTLGLPKTAEIINLIPELDLTQDVRSLSGGEEILLALSRDISLKKDVYLLDEVTSSLDDEHTETLLEALVKLSEEKLIIMASHDPRTFQSGKRIVLKDGVIRDYK